MNWRYWGRAAWWVFIVTAFGAAASLCAGGSPEARLVCGLIVGFTGAIIGMHLARLHRSQPYDP